MIRICSSPYASAATNGMPIRRAMVTWFAVIRICAAKVSGQTDPGQPLPAQ